MEAGGNSTNKRNPMATSTNNKNPAKDKDGSTVTIRVNDKEGAIRGVAVAATARQVKLDPTAAAWNPTSISPTATGPVAATPVVSAWSNKQSTIDTIKAAATKPVVGASSTAKPASHTTKVVPEKTSKGQPQQKPTQHPNHHKKGTSNNNKQDKTTSGSKAPQKITSSMKQPQAPPIISAVGGKNTTWAGTTAAALVAKQHHPQLPQAALENIAGKKHTEQHQQRQHHAHHNNKHHHHHHNKDHAGKKLDAKDANLLEPQDGVSDQDGIVRFSHSTLLQLRILFLNPPEDMEVSSTADTGNTATSKWHREFVWTSPTRESDIMLQHLHPRTTKPYQYGDQQQHPSRNHQPSSMSTNAEEHADDKNSSENKASSKDDPNIFINEFGEEIYVKPLVVNEETRWKPKSAKESADEDKDADAAVIQKALLILNKLTPTNFPKLSEQFCDEVISSESLLVSGIKLLIAKAQQEPHFCPMYAQVCQALSSKPLPFETNDDEGNDKRQKPGKTFKRHLLEECQQEFEFSTMRDKPENTEELTSEEVEYRTRLAKKKYLGHMTFIGEIYKVGLCNTKVMLMCLPILLDSSSGENVDEENIECFVKLMATIGEKLQNDCTTQAQQKGKPESLKQLDMSWERVHSIIHPQNHETRPVSNRIKFMLQDLIELRDNGWVARRKLETAKTLQEIHSEAAKEMPRGRVSSSSSLRSLAAGSSSSLMRGLSTEDVKNIENTTDSDGFTTVAKVKRTQSQSSLRRAESGGSINSGISHTPGNFRRSISDATNSPSIRRKRSQEKVSDYITPYPQLPDSSASSSIHETKAATDAEAVLTPPDADRSLSNFDTIPELSDEQPLVKLLSPAECGQKVKSVLKDYLVNHDASDAYVSYEEIIQPSQSHSLERGSKCVEASFQFMMEQSKARLETFLLLWKTLVLGSSVEADKKPAIISRPMILDGLRHPLDALADIMIDAPLANVILIKIVASTMHWGALVADVSFLLELAAESSFLAEGYAEFGVNLLRALSQLSGSDSKVVLDNNVDTIRKLMTPDEAEEWKSVNDFIKTISERGAMI